MWRRRLGMSSLIMSPSSYGASGSPRNNLSATCSTQEPWEVPLKRASELRTRKSSGKAATELAELGYLNSKGNQFEPSSIKRLIEAR